MSARLPRGLAPVALLALACLLLSFADHEVLAQAARKPFAVGAPEAAGDGSAWTQWILGWQAAFKTQLTAAMKATKAGGAAIWGLIALSFGYGVFHAAGPGHGKAVVASYMLANEQALRRGLVLSFLAAMLQGLVAVALVAGGSLLFNATAQQMNGAANTIETASYAAIAALGAWLLWRKGGALLAALRPGEAARREQVHAREHGHEQEHEHAHERDHNHDHNHNHEHDHHKHAHGEHVHDEHCGHFHAPDPATLGQNFRWGSAVATVFAAGSRPCSGAILVLVFALAQGVFLAGVFATFAMSLGTAITTGALAALAVLAKSAASRLAGPSSRRAMLIGAAFEAAAALAVLALGLVLLAGVFYAGHGE